MIVSIKWISLAVLVFGLILSSPSNGQDEEVQTEEVSPLLTAYDAQRSEYRKEHSDLVSSIENEMSEYDAQLAQEESYSQTTQREIEALNRRIAQSSTNEIKLSIQLRGLTTVLFPELLVVPSYLFFKDINSILVSALVICIIWIFLLCISASYMNRPWLNKNKFLVFCGLSILSVLFIGSAIAQEEDAPLSINQELSGEFAETNQLLNLNEHQRYNRLLRSSGQLNFFIPELSTNSPYLTIFSNVTKSSGEYFMTLAGINNFLGNVGIAAEEISKIDYNNTETENRDSIFINALKFLIEHDQNEAASLLFEKHINSVRNTELLISLADFLNENQLESSATRALDQATTIASSSSELISLAEYFNSNNQTEQSGKAVRLAYSRITSASEFIEVLKIMTIQRLLPETESLFNKYKDLYQNGARNLTTGDRSNFRDFFFNKGIEVIDILSQSGFNQMSAEWFSALLKDTDLVGASLYAQKSLMDKAISSNRLELASNVLTKIVSTVGVERRFDYKLPYPAGLEPIDGLPEPTMVSLPALTGIIYEHQQFFDRAKRAYSRSVINTMNILQESVGSNIVGDINSFFLLGETLKREGDYVALSELNSTYSLVENTNLRALEIDRDQRVINIKEEIAKYKEVNSTELATLERLESNYSATLTRLAKLERARLGLGTIIFLIVFVAAYRGITFSRTQNQQKVYSGVNKFLETIGWLKLHSIVGSLGGLILIWVGQLGLIIKSIPEEMIKLKNNKEPIEPTS